MFFDNNDSCLSNYERCQRLTSFDPCNISKECETAPSEVQAALTHPLSELYNLLERFKPVTMEWQGETSELQSIQHQIFALQRNIANMVQKQSEGLITEWNSKI